VTGPARDTPRPPTRAERVVAWLMRVARSRGAVPACVGYGTLQASVLPGPSDALFLPLAIAQPTRAVRLALATLLGGTLGSTLAWLLGAALVGAVAPGTLDDAARQLPFIDAAFIERAGAFMRTKGWLFILVSPVSPVSAKLLAYGAGIVGMPWWAFVGVLTIGRLVRYVVLVTLIRRGFGTMLFEALRLDRAAIEALSDAPASGSPPPAAAARPRPD
jgi:membrane protein YqaA with SNARE-associated domain